MMKNWYDVVWAHAGIHEGHFGETAPQSYRDPHPFFKKTYLTTSLER